MSKMIINTKIKDMDIYDLEMTFEEFKQYLDNIKSDHPDVNDSEIYFNIDLDYDNSHSIEIYKKRLETDDEYKKRIALEKQFEQTRRDIEKKKEKQNLEDEKALYKKLKKKFGDK
jgi:hypothetical protein